MGPTRDWERFDEIFDAFWRELALATSDSVVGRFGSRVEVFRPTRERASDVKLTRSRHLQPPRGSLKRALGLSWRAGAACRVPDHRLPVGSAKPLTRRPSPVSGRRRAIRLNGCLNHFEIFAFRTFRQHHESRNAAARGTGDGVFWRNREASTWRSCRYAPQRCSSRIQSCVHLGCPGCSRSLGPCASASRSLPESRPASRPWRAASAR